MKKILLAMMIVFGMSQAENYPKFDPQTWEAGMAVETKKLSKSYIESVRMCKICTKKALAYQETMRDDEYAKATLREYQRKLHKYCGPLTSAETQIDKEKAAKAIAEEEAKKAK